MLKKGMRGRLVKQLQRGLSALDHHGVIETGPGTADGIFGSNTKRCVEEVQALGGLLEDGIFGSNTQGVYNDLLDRIVATISAPEVLAWKFRIEVVEPPVLEPPEFIGFTRVPADRHPKYPNSNRGGFSRMTMRKDCAVEHMKVRAVVKEQGGILTTAGCVRSMKSGGGAAQSLSSLHYPGIAEDLSLPSGMQNLDTDPYLIEFETRIEDVHASSVSERRRFRVWCKVPGDEGEVRTVHAVTCRQWYVPGRAEKWRRRRLTITITPVEARVIDIGAIFEAHGFDNIRARGSAFRGLRRLDVTKEQAARGIQEWESRGSFSAMEWWHMQWQGGLTPGKSTFGHELQRCYFLATIRARLRWWSDVKDKVWQVDWF